MKATLEGYIMSSPQPIRPFKPQRLTLLHASPTLFLLARHQFRFTQKVDPLMSDPKKAILDQRAHILTLTEKLDLMPAAKSSLANWDCKLAKNWFEFGTLTIFSWYMHVGPSCPALLRPVIPPSSCLCRTALLISAAQRALSMLESSSPWTSLTSIQPVVPPV